MVNLIKFYFLDKKDEGNIKWGSQIYTDGFNTVVDFAPNK